MRTILVAIFMFGLMIQVRSQNGVFVSPSVFDYGNVDRWKNDTAFFTVENIGSTKFKFLPIGYSEDLLVILPKGDIQKDQTVKVKLIYFTQNRGNFRKSIPIYITSSGDPINLIIKGKIIDFHPDAMLNCPSLIEDKPPVNAEKPVEIKVIDAISGRGLIGYNLILKNGAEQQLVETAAKDRVYFDGLKNGRFLVNVSLTGYETKEESIIVNRNTRQFTIKLLPDENILAQTPPETKQKEEDPVVLEKKYSDTTNEKSDLDKLRERFNETFKDKKVVEKDVILVKEGEKDSISKDTLPIDKTKLPDFTNTGTLNKEKYASNNLVFLIDVSGSMDKPEKLPYLKKSVKDMVKILRNEDLVTIIVYSGKVRILLQGEPGSNKEIIYGIIDGLVAKGESHGSEGMSIAYENAGQHFIKDGNNEVILVSDGLFNSEDFSPKKLYKLSKQKAQNEKIITSAIGFGKKEEAIEFMKTLAENGSGSFIRILSENDAATVLIEEIMKNSMKR